MEENVDETHITDSTPEPTPDRTPEPTPSRQPKREVQWVAFEPRLLRRTIFSVVVALVIAAGLLWSANQLRGFLFNLLLAWLLAISFDPLVSGLARRGMRRGIATALVATSGIALVAGFLLLFGGALAQQVAGLVIALPTLVLDIVEWMNGTFNAGINPTEITENLSLNAEQVTTIASSLAGGVLGLFASVVGAVFSVVTILVFSFYFSADAPRIKRFLASLMRPERQVVFLNVWDISVQKAGGFVISKIALATLSAIAHVGFFWFIDIPYWLPMGIFAGVVSQFIPTIGTYIGVALPALFAAFSDPLDIIWIILFATFYQQIENYIFTPRISTATMDINSGVALASVFIGAALFGPIGAIIGIPLAAIIIAVMEAYTKRYTVHPDIDKRL
ncbi:MAG: AI-2E family transporter [Candidatus Nanopelagicales bacterium]|nr:AI-2E family transporter [Candidatus Nanopelagicales bacterium]